MKIIIFLLFLSSEASDRTRGRFYHRLVTLKLLSLVGIFLHYQRQRLTNSDSDRDSCINLRQIHEANLVYKEQLFVDEHLCFIHIFIREAPREENAPSKCIRSVAARYGCKFYNNTNTMRTCTDAMRTCTDAMRTENDTAKRIPVHAG